MAERLNDQEFDPEVLGGSIKRRIVNPLLVAERAKCDFDMDEGKNVLYTKDMQEEFDVATRLVKKYPQLATQPGFYEMTRMEKFEEWWDRLKVIMSDPEFRGVILNNSHKKSKYF